MCAERPEVAYISLINLIKVSIFLFSASSCYHFCSSTFYINIKFRRTDDVFLSPSSSPTWLLLCVIFCDRSNVFFCFISNGRNHYITFLI